ncbi:hypothetical protein NW762_010655 [Fusarium torreyae]|uniref:NADPH--cytochrome P450 reductase n=1 Tax=Fusarium torreyae TaxID=1237075 RepID=A0A9W8RU75_9HYPO|nr:hypothetical protein NW762_010655 [Fusarium torreyae]
MASTESILLAYQELIVDKFSELSHQDRLILLLALVAVIIWYRKTTPNEKIIENDEPAASISDQLYDRQCMVLFGSQTGTAEQFALRFAKEARERYGFDAIAANIQDYDPASIKDVPNDKVIIFVLATYGEGEPTDNAVAFHEYLSVEASSTTADTLHDLNYAVFGLGNRTYEFFNAMCRNVDKHLQTLGAHRIGAVGEGDEAQGTLEEDFLAWKEPLWAELVDRFQLEEAQNHLKETSLIIEDASLEIDSPVVFTGQHHNGRQSKTAGVGHENPALVAVNSSYELFQSGPRNCLHLDLDLSDSGLEYETGDHVSIWPINSNKETDRLLRILGLTSQRHKVIELRARDTATPVSFPSPTTYDALVRFYADICGPVSRQALANLVEFAPNEGVKAEVLKLSQDKEYFRTHVTVPARTLAQVLETSGQGLVWDKLPFAVLLECLQRLIPRRYSISSSASEEPSKISITAVVEQKEFDQQEPFLGTCSNYLLALKRAQNSDVCVATHALVERVFKLPIEIKKSKFRLPKELSTPVIMIGPGTGVAPFRGFTRERAQQVKAGYEVGRMMLFYGSRRRNEDFLYQDEWIALKKDLGDNFQLVTAFSRESAEKVYVQHRLLEKAYEINKLLAMGAHVYICGDAANMAVAVKRSLVHVIETERGISTFEAESVMKQMRQTRRLQEDVW